EEGSESHQRAVVVRVELCHRLVGIPPGRHRSRGRFHHHGFAHVMRTRPLLAGFTKGHAVLLAWSETAADGKSVDDLLRRWERGSRGRTGARPARREPG